MCLLTCRHRLSNFLILFFLIDLSGALAWAQAPHNLILFIPDGLRPESVNVSSTPTFARVRDQGVRFADSHSVFPTLTIVNSAAMGTGHFPGDTGNYGNTIYTGFPVASANGSVAPMVESDAILGEINAHFGGNYLNEETLLAAARNAGFLTAAVGKVGPAAIYDVTERSGAQTIVIDDLTGRPGGLLLSNSTLDALQAAMLPNQTPVRGDNSNVGDAKTPGTHAANVAQQRYFADVTTKSLLPMFKAARKPFVLVFWSRDPDGTQHNQGDSLNQLVPGINGPTSQAAVKNADDNLAAILDTLKALGLDATTDVIVSADHGFSTISKTAKLARHRKSITKMFRPASCHRGLSPSTSRKRSICASSILTRSLRRSSSPPASIRAKRTVSSALIQFHPTSWSPPMVERIWFIYPRRMPKNWS